MLVISLYLYIWKHWGRDLILLGKIIFAPFLVALLVPFCALSFVEIMFIDIWAFLVVLFHKELDFKDAVDFFLWWVD